MSTSLVSLHKSKDRFEDTLLKGERFALLFRGFVPISSLSNVH